MNNIKENKPSDKGPILLPRGDGLGWTLNFDRPISYVILGGILLLVIVVMLTGWGIIKW